MFDTEEKWTKYAADKLVGRTITSVRYMTQEEAEDLDWYSCALVIELDDGTILYPSQDEEGNGPGALFGNQGDEELTFPTLRK